MENKEIYNSTYKFNRIKYFPISFLAICLGLIGFTLAWQKAEQILNLPFAVGMSNSYKIAIEEGSNMVRLGTIIFGMRKCALQ